MSLECLPNGDASPAVQPDLLRIILKGGDSGFELQYFAQRHGL